MRKALQQTALELSGFGLLIGGTIAITLLVEARSGSEQITETVARLGPTLLFIAFAFFLPRQEVISALKLRQSVWKTLLFGLMLGVLVLIIIGSASYLLSQSSIQPIDEQFLWPRALMFVGASIVAPLGEEFYFRGLLIERFDQVGLKWLGLFYQAILFGFGHDGLFHFLLACLLGLLLGLLALNQKQIWTGVIIHSLLNIIGLR